LITLMVMLAVPAIVSSHRFLKKTSGLPEKMNEFAAQGCRYYRQTRGPDRSVLFIRPEDYFREINSGRLPSPDHIAVWKGHANRYDFTAGISFETDGGADRLRHEFIGRCFRYQLDALPTRIESKQLVSFLRDYQRPHRSTLVASDERTELTFRCRSRRRLLRLAGWSRKRRSGLRY